MLACACGTDHTAVAAVIMASIPIAGVTGVWLKRKITGVVQKLRSRRPMQVLLNPQDKGTEEVNVSAG